MIDPQERKRAAQRVKAKRFLRRLAAEGVIREADKKEVLKAIRLVV